MEVYIEIQNAILQGNAQKTVELIKKSLDNRYPSEVLLQKGIVSGVELFAEKFRQDKLLVPEVLMSTRAAHAGIYELTPHLKKDREKKSENLKVMMGVVSGDLHDIGKNIVKTFISTLNFEIIDLGINISKEQFVKSVKEHKPDVLMISALLTTTMPEVKVVIDELEKNKIRKDVTIFIGGGPISEQFRQHCGADYFIPGIVELRNFLDENRSMLKQKSKSK